MQTFSSKIRLHDLPDLLDADESGDDSKMKYINHFYSAFTLAYFYIWHCCAPWPIERWVRGGSLLVVTTLSRIVLVKKLLAAVLYYPIQVAEWFMSLSQGIGFKVWIVCNPVA